MTCKAMMEADTPRIHVCGLPTVAVLTILVTGETLELCNGHRTEYDRDQPIAYAPQPGRRQ